MKVVILGYGKMGQLIEKFAMKRGHEIFLVVDKYNRDSISARDIADADVAIDFSEPAAALDNIHLCFEANLPIVVGTTGWYEQDRKSTRLNSSHVKISYAVFCLKKKNKKNT